MMLKSSWEMIPGHVTFTGQVKLGEVIRIKRKPPDEVFQHVNVTQIRKSADITPHKRGETTVPFDHNGSLPLRKRMREPMRMVRSGNR